MEIDHKFLILLIICISYVTYCSATFIFWAHLAAKGFEAIQGISRRQANSKNPFPYPPRPYAGISATASSLVILGPFLALAPTIALPLQMLAHKNRLGIKAGLGGAIDSRLNGTWDAGLRGAIDAHLNGITDAGLRGAIDARLNRTTGAIGAGLRGAIGARIPGPTDARPPLTIGARLPPPTDARLPHTIGARLPPPTDARLPHTIDTGLPPPTNARLPHTIGAGLPSPTDPRSPIDARLPGGEMEPGTVIEKVREGFDEEFKTNEQNSEISEQNVRNRPTPFGFVNKFKMPYGNKNRKESENNKE